MEKGSSKVTNWALFSTLQNIAAFDVSFLICSIIEGWFKTWLWVFLLTQLSCHFNHAHYPTKFWRRAFTTLITLKSGFLISDTRNHVNPNSIWLWKWLVSIHMYMIKGGPNCNSIRMGVQKIYQFGLTLFYSVSHCQHKFHWKGQDIQPVSWIYHP